MCDLNPQLSRRKLLGKSILALGHRQKLNVDEGVVNMTMAEAVQSFRDRFPFYQRILSALETDQVTFGLEISPILTGEASRVVGAALTSITFIILRVMKETISEHNALTK
jgi:hypothetical protein